MWSGSLRVYFSISSMSSTSPCSIFAWSAALNSSRERCSTIPAPMASPRTLTTVRKRSLQRTIQLPLHPLLGQVAKKSTEKSSECNSIPAPFKSSIFTGHCEPAAALLFRVGNIVLLCCSFFCSLDQPYKTLQRVQVALLGARALDSCIVACYVIQKWL